MKDHRCFVYCERTAAAAAAILRDLADGKAPTAAAIRSRRKKDQISRRSLFNELDRAFLTPMDREDLWRSCLDAAAMLAAAEELALRARQPVAREILQLAEQVQQAAAGLRASHEEAVTQALVLCEQAEYAQLLAGDEPTHRLADACCRFGEDLLTAVLKNG